MTANNAWNGNPFLAFDPAKLMAEFDPTRFATEFAKLAEHYKVPSVDVGALVEAQRRNIEALTAANKTATEGAHALAKQQAEVLQHTLDAARKAFDTLGKAGTPQEAAAKQAEIAKDVFETAVANATEVAELVAKSNAETAQVITGRIAEGLDEIRSLTEKLNG